MQILPGASATPGDGPKVTREVTRTIATPEANCLSKDCLQSHPRSLGPKCPIPRSDQSVFFKSNTKKNVN